MIRNHARAALRCCLVVGPLLLACAMPVAAQMTGKGEAGLAIASGNTDSKTANAKLALDWKLGNWDDSLGFAALYVRTDGDTTARRWESTAQTRYSFGGDGTFWFGAARYEVDHFSGFNHQGVLDTGLGHKFIATDATKLSGQLGVGYKFSQTFEPPRETDNHVVGTASLDFSQQLTATTTFTNKFGAEVASGNKFLQEEAGIAVKVSDRLALALAYAVRHNTAPPAGFKKTDTLSTVNLVYEVK